MEINYIYDGWNHLVIWISHLYCTTLCYIEKAKRKTIFSPLRALNKISIEENKLLKFNNKSKLSKYMQHKVPRYTPIFPKGKNVYPYSLNGL